MVCKSYRGDRRIYRDRAVTLEDVGDSGEYSVSDDHILALPWVLLVERHRSLRWEHAQSLVPLGVFN